MKIKYRADIDGLRAIAVLSVVVNHAGTRFFPGGFIGVDIFFVVSGYLITTIIIQELDSNEFSLAKFYQRRIRRIYPALFTTLFFTIAATAILYDAYAFRDFSTSLIATTVFASNIFFWTQTGYFEGDAALKPLLHTWSLAVEEQYYILFPLLIMLIARYFRPKIAHILTGIAIFSFCWNIYTLQSDPSGAFYFAHLRAWELLIGSILALNPVSVNTKPLIRNILSILGLGMITVPIFLYSSNTTFPGFAAAIPALGTALIIYSGIANFTFVNKLLSTPPLVFIGQISYSLYLWHWSIINFTIYYAIRKLTQLELLSLLLCIFILATLSWQFIEKPFRTKTLLRNLNVFSSAAIVMILTTVIGSIIYFNNGFPNPQNTGQTAYEDEIWLYEKCNFTNTENSDQTLKFCSLGANTQTASFFVWGDSHASALAKGIDLSAAQKGVTGLMIYGAGCPPLLDVASGKKSPCIDFNNKTLQYIKDHPELKSIILAARWAEWAEGTGYKEKKTLKLIDLMSKNSKGNTNAILFQKGLNRTVENLLDSGRKVTIISQVPEIKYNVASSNFIAQRTGRDINKIIAPSRTEYLSRNRKVFLVVTAIQDSYNVQVIDPWKALCNDIQCLVAINETPLYTDDNHLSIFGSEYISKIYDPLFEEIAKAADKP